MLVKLYRYFNLLSLDVVLGACLQSWVIANYLNVQIPLASYLALSICIWLIYTLDRLIDVHRLHTVATSNRHLFHHQNFLFLTIASLMVASLGLSLLFFLPLSTLYSGALLLVIVIMYLLFTSYLRMSIASIKEILIAIIYSSTVFMLSLSIFPNKLPWAISYVFVQFLGIALLNLVIFSFIEERQDFQNGFRSFVLSIGKEHSRCVIFLIQIILYSSFLFSFLAVDAGDFFETIQVLYLVMTVTLSVLFFFQRFLLQHELYRVIGDCVFIFPAFLIFLP